MFWRRCIIIVLTGASILPLRGAEVADALPPIPIYVFAGQSNMVGAYAKTAELASVAPRLLQPQGDVRFWGPTTDAPLRWVTMRPPTEVLQSTFLNGFGPELAAAQRLSAQQPGATIGVFKFARNGSNLYHRWHPDNAGGLFHEMTTALRDARRALAEQTGRPTRIAGFFWAQGEADGQRLQDAEAYGRNLQGLIAAVRRYAGNSRLPVVMAQVADLRRWYPTVPHSDMVRLKQYQVAALDDHAFLVRTDDLTHDPVSAAHYDTAGLVRLGERMANRVAGIT